MDGKIIQPHCDQRYSPDGEFLQNQNSQAQNTPTAILVIGDTRQLSFDLYCYKGTEQKFIMKWGEFHLTHGSLFILDPMMNNQLSVMVLNNMVRRFSSTDAME